MNGSSHRANTIVVLAKVMVPVVVDPMGIVVVLAKVMVPVVVDLMGVVVVLEKVMVPFVVVVNDRAEDHVLESRMHLL